MEENYLSHLAMSNLNAVCYISDMETYDLIYINEEGKKLLGLKNIDFKGHKCYEVLQGKTEICSFCTNSKLSKGIFYEWKFTNPKLKQHFELKDTIIELEGKDVRLEFAFDVTKAKNKIEKLKTQLTFEETLLKCAQALSEHKNMKNAINNLLGIICRFFEADRSYIVEIFEEDKINNTYEWSEKGIEPQIDNLQMLPIDCVAYWFERFEKEGEFFITSLENDKDVSSDTYEILEPQGINSLMAAPLIIDGKTIGFLGVDNPRTNTLDTALIRGVTLFVTSELEKNRINDMLERSSYLDNFTNIYNRNKYIQVIEDVILKKLEFVGIVYLDINGLKKANDEKGHEYGDYLILKLVKLLKLNFPYDLFRIGGDEFVGLYFGNNQEEFKERSLSLQQSIDKETDISVSLGSLWTNDTSRMEEQIAKADALMYENKQSYYREKNITDQGI